MNLKEWIESRLNRRFLAGTAIGLLMSICIFILLFVGMYKSQINEERKQTAFQVTHLLRTSLENAMLKRDLEGLRSIVSGLGQQENIVNVMIVNPLGEVRFSSAKEKLGKHIQIEPKQTALTTSYINDETGREVMRSINPVHNHAPCSQCHGPVEKHPINGILYIDYDAASLKSQASHTTLILMSSGALIVLINIAGGWWFFSRYIIRPVNKLSVASLALSDGILDTRVELPGSDELARLGQTFNHMAENLQEKICQLGEKEAFLQQLIDAIPDGVRILTLDFQILLANRTYREQLGLDNTATLGTCYQSSHACQTPCAPTMITCPVNEIGKHSQPIRALHRHVRSDGSGIDVEIYAAPLKATIDGNHQLLIVESIRDLEKTVKYSQEQRLSELGRLATGVAHEIYNPLSSVRIALHASQQAINELEVPSEEASSYLQLLDKEVDKCIEVTQRLLKLGAPAEDESTLIDVAPALNETLSLLKWEAEKDHIRISENLTPHLRILATDSDIRMIALNLAQNAFHAMPAGGEITIHTERKKGEIVIAFQDTGVGISTDDLKHIFDPFFSRRADGSHGAGLGLSITHSLIAKLHGRVEVTSEQNHGSTFTLIFPDPDYRIND